MGDKSKISIDDQIDDMKTKGIRFEIFSEQEAKDFLTFNTYYFKFKSYAKSFERNKSTNRYINLDFAYIVELSTLDSRLRLFIIDISLSIEHALKTMLIRDITNNQNEDGYSIIQTLFSKYPFIESNIRAKKKDSACADLACKFHPNWPIWGIVEILTFGDFIKLFNLYYDKYPTKDSRKISDLLWSAKFIRNAAAHNNCLLNSLRIPYIHTHLFDNTKIAPTKRLQLEIGKVPGVSKKTKNKMLRNPVIHDFTATLLLFDWVCKSDAMKKHVYDDLNELFRNRFLRHPDYFKKDTVISSVYSFLIKIVDYVSLKNI